MQIFIQPSMIMVNHLKTNKQTVLLKILFINSICAFYNLIAHKLHPKHPPKTDSEQCCPS